VSGTRSQLPKDSTTGTQVWTGRGSEWTRSWTKVSSTREREDVWDEEPLPSESTVGSVVSGGAAGALPGPSRAVFGFDDFWFLERKSRRDSPNEDKGLNEARVGGVRNEEPVAKGVYRGDARLDGTQVGVDAILDEGIEYERKNVRNEEPFAKGFYRGDTGLDGTRVGVDLIMDEGIEYEREDVWSEEPFAG
jgi:hypothetical protein